MKIINLMRQKYDVDNYHIYIFYIDMREREKLHSLKICIIYALTGYINQNSGNSATQLKNYKCVHPYIYIYNIDMREREKPYPYIVAEDL